MPAFISEPCRGVIYILEPARRGSRKLNASAMPAIAKRATGLSRIAPSRSPFAEPPKPFSRSRPDDRRSRHHFAE
jgi:hypothetical protein